MEARVADHEYNLFSVFELPSHCDHNHRFERWTNTGKHKPFGINHRNETKKKKTIWTLELV